MITSVTTPLKPQLTPLTKRQEKGERAGRPLRPFLKWAGAKTRIIERIRESYNNAKPSRLIEPFLGSGAVGLNLGFDQNILADTNQHLVDVFNYLKSDGDEFIHDCRVLFTKRNNTQKRYYAIREEFNTTTDPRRRATLFIYLNRHGFNGLCRYNSSGGFNVPFGRYANPYFPEVEMRQFAEFLARANVECADFRSVIERSGAGDFVYCDPPYVPIGKNGFTTYSSGGFSEADQRDLAKLASEAASRGAVVAISNHDTPAIRKTYEDLGGTIRGFLVARTISCDGSNRKRAKEIVAVFGGAS